MWATAGVVGVGPGDPRKRQRVGEHGVAVQTAARAQPRYVADPAAAAVSPEAQVAAAAAAGVMSIDYSQLVGTSTERVTLGGLAKEPQKEEIIQTLAAPGKKLDFHADQKHAVRNIQDSVSLSAVRNIPRGGGQAAVALKQAPVEPSLPPSVPGRARQTPSCAAPAESVAPPSLDPNDYEAATTTRKTIDPTAAGVLPDTRVTSAPAVTAPDAAEAALAVGGEEMAKDPLAVERMRLLLEKQRTAMLMQQHQLLMQQSVGWQRYLNLAKQQQHEHQRLCEERLGVGQGVSAAKVGTSQPVGMAGVQQAQALARLAFQNPSLAAAPAATTESDAVVLEAPSKRQKLPSPSVEDPPDAGSSAEEGSSTEEEGAAAASSGDESDSSSGAAAASAVAAAWINGAAAGVVEQLLQVGAMGEPAGSSGAKRRVPLNLESGALAKEVLIGGKPIVAMNML